MFVTTQTDDGFVMEVTGCFTITGHGTFVTGSWTGRLPTVGDMLSLSRSGRTVATECRGIGPMRKLDADGYPVLDATAIGVDVEKFTPTPGDTLTTIGCP